MKNWSVDATLEEIRIKINELLNNYDKEGAVLLKNIITTTPDENECLCNQFSKIISDEEFEKYCICIVVAWVESYRHLNEKQFRENLLSKYSKIPQHFQGKYLKTYRNVFYDYDLETFGLEFSSIKNIEEAIKRQAEADV